MSISGLDNPTDELVEAITRHEKEIRRKVKAAKGGRNYKMGYGSYLSGFRPDKATLNGYEELYKGYAKGWRDAKKAEAQS